jgi:acetyl esterase
VAPGNNHIAGEWVALEVKPGSSICAFGRIRAGTGLSVGRVTVGRMPGIFADQQLAAYVAQTPPFGDDVAAMRAGGEERARVRPAGPDLPVVRDLRVGGLAARLYQPVAEPSALVVYLHAGGWTIGSLATHDRVCRRLADGSGAAVLALDYRLAPEHPWPASVDDTVAALRWVSARPAELGAAAGAAGNLAVCGDSAGGTLATLACLRLRGEDPRAMPVLQVLLYANTDLTGSQPSMREKATGFGLDASAVRFFATQWVPDPARLTDPGVSPLYARDLSGLPPALIVTAEHDPLRDEGEAYARRLADAGVDVELRREPGMIHNFMMLDTVSPACAAAGDRVAADLRKRLQC